MGSPDMLQEIRLSIYENDKIIDKVHISTNGNTKDLIKCLEKFRQLVNENLSQKIEDNDNLEDCNLDEELSSDEDLDGFVDSGSPKKRKRDSEKLM